MPIYKREVCDTCGKRLKVRFSNALRTFCSAECANAYLEAEGFLYRVSDDPKYTAAELEAAGQGGLGI